MVNLNTILPSIGKSLDGIGFLFGAGTSYESGYPLMPALTQSVVSNLTPAARAVMDEVLAPSGSTYDDITGTPNIERLSDMVVEQETKSGDVRFRDLEAEFRRLTLDHLFSVTSPDASNHIRFFETLKARSFGQRRTVWVFTTNYDVLFEAAAARTGVVLENGFSGATERYFDPERFRIISGRARGKSFEPDGKLTVKLVKLHGSLSWFRDGANLLETNPTALPPATPRILIPPRRTKSIETLDAPFNSLFTLGREVLGKECKYLVTCGFSFSDEHISRTLLLPAMQSNMFRLYALSDSETPGMAEFKGKPNFNAGFGSGLYDKGIAKAGGTDLWQFGKFVNLF